MNASISIWSAELRLLLRSGRNLLALILLLVLSSAAVWAGITEIADQRATIERVEAEQVHDLAAVEKANAGPESDAGYNAYYGFMLTQDPPPPLAFAAIGQRDLQPFVLRVRALGLHSQLYDSETYNPELTLPGVFDWAFVLIYLLPLVVIALAHDLVTGEREAGRLRLLLSLPGSGLWRRRMGLRYCAVLAALGLPLIVGGIVMAAPASGISFMLLTAALYCGFWFGLAMLIGAILRTSATAAAAMIGCWIVLTLIVPTLANAAIARTVPVAKGIDLTLAQREVVHRGWDIPKDETFERFFVNHPEWRGKEKFEGRFHYKWYYAMHQVGDEAVAADVAAYRASLAKREDLTKGLGFILPGVGAMNVLHRLADTDIEGQLAYQDSIAAFHKRLRKFYYPYLFNDRVFTQADFAQIPRYNARATAGTLAIGSLGALALLCLLALGLGALKITRVGESAQSRERKID
jgi:ABC-2 type transport system permease protein